MKRFLKNRTLFLMLLTLLTGAVLSLMSPYFLTPYNLMQILHFTAVIMLISVGQNLVILAGGGGIDLSVGSIISLSGVALGLFYLAGLPIAWAAVAALLLGVCLGAVNGLAVVFVKMPPLIATLGTLYMFGGLALVLAKTGTVSGFPQGFAWIGQSSILGIPSKVLLVVAPVMAATLFVMKKTELGRNITLIGVNETAARFAGIEVNKIRFGLYIFSGLLAALGGILMASYLMTAKADVGRDIELQAITIVMLGGTSIKGGIGKVENLIFSTLMITMLSTGLQLAQINAVWQMGILGLILLTTILLNNALEKITY